MPLVKYEEALQNFENLDLLISSIYRYQSSGKIDVPSLFGSRFEKLNLFYSSPEYYTKWKHNEVMHRSEGKSEEGKDGSFPWSVKKDDFFPYSDCPHCFWTGYFTSRTGFKRLERVGSSFLQAARQIESMKDAQGDIGFDGCHCNDSLYRLDDAMGVVQHHDAVSGTAKQHVANDYAKRVQGGIDHAAKSVADKMRRILLEDTDADGKYLDNLAFCQFLNETQCDVSTQAAGKDLYVVVYNGLAKQRSAIISLPISASAVEEAPSVGVVVQRLSNQETVEGSIHLQGNSAVLYFNTGSLPPVGGSVFRVTFVSEKVESSLSQDTASSAKILSQDTASSLAARSMLSKQQCGSAIKFSGDTAEVSNGILSVRFDRYVPTAEPFF